MTDKARELYDAGFALLPFLRASTDTYGKSLDEMRNEISGSHGDRQRREADESDRKDAAILRFREALIQFGESA